MVAEYKGLSVDLNDVLIYIAGAGWTFFTAYFIFTKTKANNDMKDFKEQNSLNISKVDNKVEQVASEVNDINKKQVEHEFNFVTEKHVRDILKEEVKDIKADIITVKGNVSTILDSIQNLTIAIGVQNGIREKEMMGRGRGDGL